MNFKVKDHYFKKAKKENYLARSVYKLEEINKKYKVLEKNNIVLDLGYYPGSWLQYTSKVVGENGRIVGLDLQEINDKLKNLSNVQLYQMDFFDLRKNKKIIQKFDVILSDMAPKTTGIKTVDQLGSLNLIEEIFDLLPKHLKNNGNLVVKVFDSSKLWVAPR